MPTVVVDHSEAFLSETMKRLALALHNMAGDIKILSQVNVPQDTRELKHSAEVETLTPQHLKIWYGKEGPSGDYAAVQEAGERSGIPMVNYTKPNTGPHFLENAGKRTWDNHLAYFKVAMAKI